jgi:nuclear migration protein JNM1
VDLDRAAAAAKRNPQSTTSSDQPSSLNLSQAEHFQLTSLFALLPRLDPLIPILPPLLNRLQSLSGLHAEAGDVIEGLRRLQTDEGDSTEELRDLHKLAKTVQDGITESAKGIERNWTGVEARLKNLEERLGKL